MSSVAVEERLRCTDGVIAGSGTFVREGFVYASLVGSVHEENQEDGRILLSVVGNRANVRADVVPAAGDVVIGRVHSLTRRFAKVDIICVRDIPMKSAHPGILNKANVRDFEIDKVEMSDCYRPGDIIRAEVLSLGDSRAYFLSTARPELGVIRAESDAGYTLEPIAHDQMRCPHTKDVVPRKVAKCPDQEPVKEEVEEEEKKE